MTATDRASPTAHVQGRLVMTIAANAAFSGGSAAVMLIFSEAIASLIEVPRAVLLGVGVGLAPLLDS